MQLQSGQRVLVMGLAKSGRAAAQLLRAHGLNVCVNDRRQPLDPDPEAEALAAAGIEVVLGDHPMRLLSPRPDFIVKNPGIPYSVPLVAEAGRLGIPIYTEIEVASWLTQSPIYAVTGSNGKTTTTSLIGAILSTAGQHPVVAGNIGTVLSGVVEGISHEQPIVLEVSSFQLAGTEFFHPRIGVLLNLYKAHLDYHGTFENYVAAKWRMFRNMTASDLAVLNYDQPLIRTRAKDLPVPVAWFSSRGPVPTGTGVRDGTIFVWRGGDAVPILPVREFSLPGQHNLENALAALAVALWAGASTAAAAQALANFQGIEHRLEFVQTIAGVDFYNDSKATNPEAALRALRAFSRPVVWIAGGLDRGIDFSEMTEDLARHVRVAVLYGQTAGILEAACKAAGVPEIVLADDFAAAVHHARAAALPGETVLLSPACASWDMFQSFEARGRMFKDIVHTL